MEHLMEMPVVAFVVCLALLWVSAQVGAYIRRLWKDREEILHQDLDVVLGAALTLLALIVGFTLSMAVGRYDQRKNYEEEEANAIGTEYLRVGLLPAPDAAKERELLRSYLEQRILFYTTHDLDKLEQIDAATARLQNDLWSALQAPATAQPTPVMATIITGMNDVLNRQGYTQAAWWYRIPVGAWALMLIVAICCNLLVGFNTKASKGRARLFFVLPLIISIAFFLIADIDSPRRGVIQVSPHNLISLSQSLSGPQTLH